MKKMALMLTILMMVAILATGCALLGAGSGALIGGAAGGPRGALLGAGVGLLAGGAIDYARGTWDFRGRYADGPVFTLKVFSGVANRVILLSDGGGEYALQTGKQVEVRYPIFPQGYQTTLTARVEDEGGRVLGTAMGYISVPGFGYGGYGYINYRTQDVWHLMNFYPVR